jgi:hypothetical protein
MLAPDGLYVFKQRHLYHVYAQDIEQIQVTPLTLAGEGQRSVGTESIVSLTTTPYGIAFYSRGGGVYLLRGLEVAPIGLPIAEAFRKAEVLLGSPVVGYSSAWDQLWLSVRMSAAPIARSYLFDFSPSRREWIARSTYRFVAFAEIERPAAGIDPTFFALGGEGSTDQEQHFFALYSSETDGNGDPIAASAELSPFFGRNPAADKMLLGLDVLFEPKASGSFTLRSVIDGVTGSPINATIPMAVPGVTGQHQVRVNLHHRGHNLAFTIESTTSSPRWKVYGLLPLWHEYRATARAS